MSRRSDFQRLRREGRTARVGGLAVRHIGDPTTVPPQLAYAIPRAVGGAVIRNRVRRVLRAAAHQVAPPPGLTLVRVLPGRRPVDPASLRSDQLEAFSRLGAS